MPNIVQLWDFEDGTTQGWSLGSETSISSGSSSTGYPIQGNYGMLVGFTSGTTFVASISNIDLSAVNNPFLVMLVRATSLAEIYIRVYDGTGTLLFESTRHKVRTTSVVVIDMSQVAGMSGLIIELWKYSSSSCYTWFDMIAIIDGSDYEYNTGVLLSDDEDKTVEVSVPDQDVSGATSTRVGISLITTDWDYTNVSVTAVTDQGEVSIDSSSTTTTHCNLITTTDVISQFTTIRVYARVSIGSYAGWTERISVMFLDSNWNYRLFYIFNVYFTANGINPRYANVVHSAFYGSSVTAYKDFNVKIHATGFDVALKVKYIYGDSSVVVNGTVRMAVYSSDLSTKYGEVSIDLTTGNEQTTQFISGLPPDTDLVIRIEWSITANARVILAIYPLFKVY